MIFNVFSCIWMWHHGLSDIMSRAVLHKTSSRNCQELLWDSTCPEWEQPWYQTRNRTNNSRQFTMDLHLSTYWCNTLRLPRFLVSTCHFHFPSPNGSRVAANGRETISSWRAKPHCAMGERRSDIIWEATTWKAYHASPRFIKPSLIDDTSQTDRQVH